MDQKIKSKSNFSSKKDIFPWKDAIFRYLKTAPAEKKSISGTTPEAAPLVILREYFRHPETPLLVAAADAAGAEHLCNALRIWCRILDLQCRTELLPETVRGKMISGGGEGERARVLLESLNHPPEILCGSVYAFTAPVPPPEQWRKGDFTLRCGDRISPMELAEKLAALDYDDEAEVNITGEFSRRGGIFDLFSPAHKLPCRIEFFGDEIDSIRSFSPETQRSVEILTECRVIPPHPSADAERAEDSGLDFFNFWEDRTWHLTTFFPESCMERLALFADSRQSDRFAAIREMQFARNCAVDLADLVAPDADSEPAGCFPPLAGLHRDLPPELRYGALELLRELQLDRIRHWLAEDCTIALAASGEESMQRLIRWKMEFFPEESRIKPVLADPPWGVFLPEERCVVLTEREILTVNAFGKGEAPAPAQELPAKFTRFRNDHLRQLGEAKVLSELNDGDYAVHLHHGICIFRGLTETVTPQGVRREVLKLEFQDNAMLFVPLSQAGLVSRYLGASGRLTLHKLSNSRWKRDREKAEVAVRDYAADMLRLQAVRAASPGTPFPPDGAEQRLFEESFPWQDTQDQKRSTREIKEDMENPRPMDRLLCGDVGYGKTEVAIRAAFKAVSAGKQVVVLAPTTVLAKQHYYTFRERFAGYPYVIEELSRLRTPSDQAKVIGHLASGGVDIVIGTRRLCNPEIRFANLGLVIIDEEQRFGVMDKEHLRRLRVDVDILTMSATPIPRTLYLAMAGARDLSTLQTPPAERTPVKTIVAPEDPAIITAAIREEVARGGQLYYLHNRVRTIEDCRDKLAKMLPEIRFGIAHGQLPEQELDQVMTAFIAGEIDCLVCSTIIESGLDIPNANSIIIERADRFGLAQLYQLRGRVGRSSRRAVAYLLLPKYQIMTGDARKRIAAIRRCSNLGAGFRLALHDLEIRGSGNLLGAEQSGHLNLIGFDLYCQLLQMEIARLKGERLDLPPETEVLIDFVAAGYEAPAPLLAAGFPPSYIPDAAQRLTVCRRTDRIASLDEWQDFRKELIDRYGPLPKPAETLLKIAELRLLTAAAHAEKLQVEAGKVYLKSKRGIYRKNGLVPTVSEKNPPELRLALIRHIVLEAQKSEEI